MTSFRGETRCSTAHSGTIFLLPDKVSCELNTSLGWRVNWRYKALTLLNVTKRYGRPVDAILASANRSIRQLSMGRRDLAEFVMQHIQITETGSAILSRERDFWLRDVRVESGPEMYAWDEVGRTIRRLGWICFWLQVCAALRLPPRRPTTGEVTISCVQMENLIHNLPLAIDL